MNTTKLLLIIFLSCLLYSCKDEYTYNSILRPSLNGRYLNLSKSTFIYPESDSLEDVFKVESMGTAWNFSNPPEWITLLPSSGTSTTDVSLFVKENTTGTSRAAIFYLESSDKDWIFKKGITVSQEGKSAVLFTEPSELFFSGKGEKNTIFIMSNCDWSAKCVQDWISLTLNDTNELIVEAQSNLSNNYREGIIIISYDNNKNITIPITQYPSEITASEMTLEFYNNFESKDIKINSESDWYTISSESWIRVVPSKGVEGNSIVSIEVTENMGISARTGYITFFTGEYERFQIKIIQKGLYIETVDELFFKSKESSQTLQINSNTSWEVLTAPEWISISPKYGEGKEEIEISVDSNPNSFERYGIINLGHAGLSIECQIKVSQEGSILAAETNLLEFNDKPGVQSFELISEEPWTSLCTDKWFKINPSTGNGDALIVVEVEENINSSERTGKINFNFGNIVEEVTIRQQGKYLILDNVNFEFPSKGGEKILSFSSNDSWQISIPESVNWLNLSRNSGEGSGEVLITVEDNPSTYSRTAQIKIIPLNSQSILIPIIQEGRYLKVSSESLEFFAEGGISDLVTIETDGEFEIFTSDVWFSVNQISKNTFQVLVDKNTSGIPREGNITIALTDITNETYRIEIKILQQ